MADAQNTVLVYRRNGRLHILLQQIYGGTDESISSYSRYTEERTSPYPLTADMRGREFSFAAGPWFLRSWVSYWIYFVVLFPLYFGSFAEVCAIT
jgi:hypothetical protein